jgi:hypothetical protein
LRAQKEKEPSLQLPYLYNKNVATTQVQSSRFTPARPDCIGTGGVQWLFAEPLTVKRRFFMSRLRSLGMDNGSWLQFEALKCEPLAQT